MDRAAEPCLLLIWHRAELTLDELANALAGEIWKQLACCRSTADATTTVATRTMLALRFAPLGGEYM
eukprot:1083661-Rhodomonas_salina.1